MPSNVMTPRTKTGEVSFVATADTVGKRFLAPSGDRTGGLGLSTDLQNVYRMAHCGAGKKAAGVNKYDVLSGKRGGCYGIPGSKWLRIQSSTRTPPPQSAARPSRSTGC
jgi:hypothetical protein